ncbi:holin [Campylobacter phage F370]|uniref:Holin n=1 Tax=Campylobacter phage F372 TaxID=2794375 RepID=A0A7T3N5C6_9CAUD|nr:holin [Campylobacter phage F370]QPX65151.1 holin [Campylobacter phage F371]QPX65314.1 holin [Campylobacter phage F372]
MNYLLELSPIFIVGLICGLSNYLSDEEDTCTRKHIKCILKYIFNSAVLCTIIYCILTSLELPYLTKIGVAGAITYLGIDKAMSLIKEFIHLKK